MIQVRDLPKILYAFQRLNLWPRLVIAVTLGFLVLFGIFSLLSLRAVNDSTKRILQERLVIAQMAAKEIDGTVENAFYELDKATEFAPFDPEGLSLVEEFHMLAHAYGRVGALSLGVYYLDSQGRVVLSHPPGKLPKGYDLSNESHIRQVMDTETRSVSQPFQDPTTDKPAIALTIPIFKDGELISMLSGLLDVSSGKITNLLMNAQELGNTGHAELVDSRGLIIASTDYGGFLKPGEHLHFYLKMFQEGKADVKNVLYVPWHAARNPKQNEHHVMAFAPTSAAPWGVAVGGADWETFAPVNRLRNTILLTGALSLAFLWVLTLIGARLLVRPVKSLIRAAGKMASGDLDQPIRVAEGGEIGILGENLEAMRVQLKASMERVQEWGEQLETEVTQRTEELSSRNRQLAAVTAVATAANEIRDLKGILRRCLEVVLAHTQMDTAAIRLLDDTGLQLVIASSQGDFSGFPCRTQAVALDECPCGYVASNANPLYLSRDEHPGTWPPCKVPQISAIAILPLKSPKGTLGVLSLSRSHGNPPSPEERGTLNAICNQIAVAIDSARLLQELSRIGAQRELDRVKAEFISAISHELRTPLGFIKGYTTTLLRDDISVEPATRKEFLEVINEESTKLQRMIDDLLDASRLQAGRFQVYRRAVPLKELMENALHKVTPTLEEQGHSLKAHITDQPTEVLVDTVRIEQVLRNLLENASRYSERGSSIEVDAVVQDQQVRVSVKDYGDGIPLQELEQVFEPFYRGDNSRRRGAHGAGLGLAICRGIIQSHDGRLWVESDLAHGSTFFFTIPLAKQDGAEIQDQQDTSERLER